jgi:hypothetical protein
VQVSKWTIAILEGNLAGIIPDAVSQYDNIHNSKSVVAIISKKRKLWEDIDVEERKLTIEEKRQKLELEKQNHLLMLYKRPIFATDDMMKQLIKDRLANFIKDNSSSSYKSRFCKDISEIAYDLSYKMLKHGEKISLGKYLAEAFKMKFPTETIFKTERFTMGEMRDVNTYSVDKEDWLTKKVNKWCAMKKIRKRH